MEHGDQIEAVAPVFLEIGIQDCGMNQVAVHDSPGYRGGRRIQKPCPFGKFQCFQRQLNTGLSGSRSSIRPQ